MLGVPGTSLPPALSFPGVCAVRAPARPRALQLRAAALQSLDAARALQQPDVPVLRGAAEADPGCVAVSRARGGPQALADDPRRGAAPLRRGLRARRPAQQRHRLQFLLHARLEALLPE